MGKTQDFIGFRFGPYHSSDLKLILVSSGNRYQKNLLPTPTDYTADISGGDGKYYFGQTFKEREIKVNIAFTDISEMDFRRLAQIFSTDKLQDLVFDEQPYKTYKAKCKSAPDFKFICFKDSYTNQRIYKGEGTINFVCYHPFAYCFNKYVVTAADYYKTETPESILNPESIYTNPYKDNAPPRLLTNEIKEHYNTINNMNTKWDGGYPSIEQVQWGELYYNENGEKKLLSEVRRYWDNIPQWQTGAQLLTTPTLDYDQELIYMPQYCRTNYYNMETGINKQNALIGTRVLVYNPGDIPIDFTLYLNNLKNQLREIDDEPYRFRISRYNVQRLTVEQAVDWTKLKTYDPMEEETFKYGTHYVNIQEAKPEAGINVNPTICHLQNSHPNHLYIAEPVPRDRLAYYLKIFVYQTYQSAAEKRNNAQRGSTTYDNCNKIYRMVKTYYNGELKEILNSYQENYDACINDDEKNELYWETLQKVLKDTFERVEYVLEADYKIFNEDTYTIDDYLYDYIHDPLEGIYTSEYHNYGEFLFNAFEQLNFITEDYIEIESSNDFPSSLTLDFSKRLLYNNSENPKSKYNFEAIRTYYNDHILSGHWFMLPPGWSLIEVTPVINESIFSGKRWKDARSFQWGTMPAKEKSIYNRCEQLAAIKYVAENSPESNLKRELEEFDDTTHPFKRKRTKEEEPYDYNNKNTIKQILANELYTDTAPALGEQDYIIEEFLQFRRWYEGIPGYESYLTNPESIYKGVWKTKITKTEFNFLKLLNDYWRLAHLGEDGYPTSDAEDWWWNANNYLWINFPPAYWSYVDILNEIKVEYTPEYY